MRTRTLALASLLALVACGGQEATVEETAPSTTSTAPGDSVDLNQTFASLIGGTGAGIEWRWGYQWTPPVQATQAGLALTPAGVLTLPGCNYVSALGGTFPLAIYIDAWAGSTRVLSVPITVDEKFLGATVGCYILSGETLCRDPAATGIVAEAGTTATFYSKTSTTCRSYWTPALPQNACPIGDAAYTFCR